MKETYRIAEKIIQIDMNGRERQKTTWLRADRFRNGLTAILKNW